MKILYDEISRRFPDALDGISDGDESLPYLLMIHLADWAKRHTSGINPQTVSRIVSFAKWCEEQPRGETAAADLLTILMVGFYEHLFDSEVTRSLLPNFFSREDLVNNAEYLRRWVGSENYDKTLAYFASVPKKVVVVAGR